MSRAAAFFIVVSMLLTAGAATAQIGTWDIPSASVVAANDTQAFTDARFWEGDNETWGVYVRGGISDDAEATVGYLDWDVTGEDPIAGAVRASEMSAVVVDLKWVLADSSPRIALRAGADFQVGTGTGINTATGGAAYLSGAIPAVSVPVEFGNPDGLSFIVEPKVVWWPTQEPTSVGTPIQGFGTIIMVGGGVRCPVGRRLTFVGDAAYPISDSNSIDIATNMVTEELAWSAGVNAEFGDDWNVGVFATTAAGPTPATSAIATPDQSVGFGVRFGGVF